jgi:hypothetical protein
LSKDQKEKIESRPVQCLVCEKEILKPSEENVMEDQFICNECRDVMLTSLEVAWKKHSAFLDSALN